MFKKINEKIEYREKKIFWILFSLFVFFLVSYGVLVVHTVSNGINKQKIAEEMHTLSTSVSALDYQYLELKNSITDELALKDGFVHIADTQFAFTNKTPANLSINKN